jgi:Xaa-Pro aminopeptidase
VSENNISLVPCDPNNNLIDVIWGSDRPQLPTSTHSIRLHPMAFAGLSPTEKLNLLRSKYLTFVPSIKKKKNSLDQRVILITSSLDEIAWLYNLRGNDVQCNPTLLAYSLISKGSIILLRLTH